MQNSADIEQEIDLELKMIAWIKPPTAEQIASARQTIIERRKKMGRPVPDEAAGIPGEN